MSDKDSPHADHLRQAKLLAARRKLKKFQTKKLDHHPPTDTESSCSKASPEAPKVGADGILFSSYGSPLANRSDILTVNMKSDKSTSPVSQSFTITSPPRTSPSVIMASSPPPPPPPASSIFSSSPPQQQTTHSLPPTSPVSTAFASETSILSSPPPATRALPLPVSHWNPQPTAPVPSQNFQLLQDKIDALQQEKTVLASHSEQLRQQLTNLNQQCENMKCQKDTSTKQHNTLAENYRLLEQRYDDVKQQLLESNNAIHSQQEKIAELQAELVSTHDSMTALIKEQQTKIDEGIQRFEHQQQQVQENDKHKWDELSELVKIQKKELDEMTASNEDFHTEITRLIDMVNDLEEELARTQADNYTKDCEIKSLNTQLYDIARGNHATLVANLEQKTQERDSLRLAVKTLEADQSKLASLGPELQALEEQLKLANQELTSLKHQLDDKNDAIRELQSTLDNKHNEHTSQLSQLQTEHDVVKGAADKWERQTNEIQRLLDEKTKDHADLKAKHNNIEAVISELEQQLHHANSTSHAKDEQIGYMKVSINQLEQQHDMMKQQLLDTKHLVEGNESTIDQLRDHIKRLEQIHVGLTRDLKMAHEVRATHDKSLEASSIEFDNLQQQHAALQQTLDEKEALYQDLLKTKDDLAHRLRRMQFTNHQHQQLMVERIDRINQKMAHIMTMYEKMERTTTDMEMKLATAAQQTNNNGNTAQQHQDLETLRQALAMTESQAKTHLDKLMEMESRSLEQQLYISKLETDQQSFDEQRRFLEQQLTHLQEDLDEKRELADMFEDARSSLVDEKATLASRLDDQLTLVSTLNTQLQERNHEIGQLQEKIKALELSSGGGGDISSTSDIWEHKHQELEQQLKDQMVAQQTLIDEKEQQEASLNDIKKTMEQLQAHANDLEQQLTLERTTSAAANDDLRQQLTALSDKNHNNATLDDNNDGDGDDNDSNYLLLQQERGQRQEQVELLEKQLTDLQEQLTELQDKDEEQQRLYDDKHQQWMAEQSKVASLTKDIEQLQEQLEQHLAGQKELQRQLADHGTHQQQQVAKEDDVDQLTAQLEEAQDLVVAKSKEIDELKAQLASSLASAPVTTSGLDEQNNSSGGSEHERALEAEVKELRSRLERQFDAFTTIRGELTTVRDRQLNAEREASKEKNDLVRQRQGLEHTIKRLRNEYQEHLEQMWEQHEAIRLHHEEDLSVGREALDSAQVKLMQNGLSPVSENGFEWVNSDSDDNDEDQQQQGDDDDGDAVKNNNKTPSVGPLPPLRKPDFFEFLETPRCNGCQSEVIDI